MVRNFIPFILALLGFPAILFATGSRVFEWQISEIIVDVPSSYEIRISPSPWITAIGDALDDNAYVLQKIFVVKDGKNCASKGFSVVVNRSRKDELLERLALWRQFDGRNPEWPMFWVLAEIALSMIYLLWATICKERRGFSFAIISGVIATIFFCFVMVPTMKLMGPRVMYMFGGTETCQGVIRFNAEIVRVHYIPPIALLAGLFVEGIALVMMVSEVVKVARNRNESSKLAVG